MTPNLWTRIALGYMALVSLQIGLWAQFAPRSFYDDFPGMGRAWVSVDGPYNEHLVRDVGGLYLALGLLIVAALVTLSRLLVLAAAAATLVSAVPHAIYHMVNRDGLGTDDLVISLSGLVLLVAVPVALIVMWREPTTA